MKTLKLFCQVVKGTIFYFGDNPNRLLVKSNGAHYIAPEGRHKINPHVLVFQNDEKSVKSIYNHTEAR